jgi:hypothetical protein
MPAAARRFKPRRAMRPGFPAAVVARRRARNEIIQNIQQPAIRLAGRSSGAQYS